MAARLTRFITRTPTQRTTGSHRPPSPRGSRSSPRSPSERKVRLETMSASQRATRSASTSTASRRRSQAQTGVGRIAVGVDDYPEGRDAVVLGAAIADVTEARLLLVTVHSAPVLPHPQWNWRNLRKHAEGHLRELRNEYAPEARITTRTGSSVPRALQRVVEREDYDLLVMGSSRDASDGHVRIGKRTRQLLCHFGCALAIAPRGMHANLRRPAQADRGRV